jgi:DNA repair photolyase
MTRQLAPDGPDNKDGSHTLKVVAWQRRAEVLTRPKLPCLAAFHTINLSAGCPNECRYCYAQSYAHHPGWGTVAYYANAREKLKEELARLRQRPRLVYFSTASEPFLPAPRVMDDMHEIMATLLETGAALLISTKGVIPDRFIELFARHPSKVLAQVGITTLDDEARRVIEPRAATVNQRLDNLGRLHAAGIGTEARMDPLVPGLTDTNDSFRTLLPALARAGVRQAVVSFLFLRWGINFPNDLASGNWSARAMRRLFTHKVTDYCGGGTIWLPEAAYRGERLSSLGAIARDSGIAVKLCRCKNSDLPEAQCCHPTDPLLAPTDDDPQLTIF